MKTLRAWLLVLTAVLLATAPPAAHAAATCLSIVGSTATVAVGTPLQFGAQCCISVPALRHEGWVLGGLLLVCGAFLLARRTRLASGPMLLLLCLVCLSSLISRPARGQTCGAPFQWRAQSVAESFTGAGTTFSFTPTQPGTFVIMLSNSNETAPSVTVDVVCTTCAPVGDSVLMHHKNASRDGAYVEPLLTKAAAAGLHVDTTFAAAAITGAVYAQPLFVDGGSTGTDLVIVATEANNVYALDAATGALVWTANVGVPVPLSSRPCGNINPFGITSTPVIDLTSRTLFVSATTTPDGGTTTKHVIAALSIDNGSSRPNWPVDVGAAIGSAFDSSPQGDRGALALVNGTLYAVYGGLFGDCGTYHGWVVGIFPPVPTPVQTWSTAANGGGIWGAGGAASDGTYLYAATGNTFGVSSWGGGEAVLRFTPGGALASPMFWAPTNWQALDNADLDLGGVGPIPFSLAGATPGKLVLALGKDGIAYLVDPANLPGVGAPVVQAQVASTQIRGAAAVYTTALATYAAFQATGTACTTGASGDLVSIKFVPGSPPTITGSWCATQGGAGSPIVTTTDGQSQAIVWSIGAESTQQLQGFDGDTGATIVSSTLTVPGAHRFNSPIAAKGRIFAAGDSGVVAFTP